MILGFRAEKSFCASRRNKIPRLHSPVAENDGSGNRSEPIPPSALHIENHSPQSRFSHAEDQESTDTPDRRTSTPQRIKAPVSFDRLSATDPEAFNQRISSAGLTQEIIDNFSPETILESSTSALPGGIGHAQGDLITVEQLLGLELPSKRVADYFLNIYIDVVHWFIMLFHEPTFRSKYEKLMVSRSFPRCRSNEVIFILLVLSIGAHYAPDEEVLQKFPTFQLKTFRALSLKKIENSLPSLYDTAELESVQVCCLLASWYVYHGRPNLAFVILGAGLRCAQLLLLHRESTWRGVSEIAKEERRRVFWALFVFDRFAATIFGRPCGIPMAEIDVRIPQNVGDTTVQHPFFRSSATTPDGTVEPVTAFSYFKFKIKLYQISSPIIGDLYFHRSRSVSELAFKVYRIDKELSDFFSALPPELKLEDLFRNPAEKVTPRTRPFMLQALALQIAYDNVQILLHRPLLSQDLRNYKTHADLSDPDRLAYSPDQSNITNSIQLSSQHVHQILLASRDKCWESAIRSSKLGQYNQCLVSARDSHAAAFLGINLFTAGMVLCVVALSRPLSSEAQTAKQAVARIMSLSRFLSGKAPLSAQTTKILKDLVRLVGEKEIKAMLAESEMAQNQPSTSTDRARSRDRDRDGHRDGDTDRDRDRNTEDTPDVTSRLPAVPARDDLLQVSDNAPEEAVAASEPLKEEFGLAGMMDAGPSLMDTFDFSGLENLDFNNGLSIVQQAMFPEVVAPDVDASMPKDEGEYNANQAYLYPAGGSSDGLQTDDFSMMNSVGQTWLWDSVSW
ncbi:hypothetical protein G647_06234 [Cladophialophora carrionii CBS 160.54]|uniref:Xylanolytic transcriptional activator regulatory domain-containing protein n=1 Tax=Cladophialophora carrionii CBS 160.54 TaxID=1279043 RepID=V9D665_9EURO|nr:uncharacterized protein G647_06234 [Cladophialophora carrionii CBS 160.54]ETI22161.1 hypothetical protein G647_06234 [Cladophialophora carrionii CBS 160.54]